MMLNLTGMKAKVVKIFLAVFIIVILTLLVTALIAFFIENKQKSVGAEDMQQLQVNYTNTIAQKCTGSKNTVEENKYLRPGLIYLYFQSGYSVKDIQNFLTRNSYQIQGEIYSELQGKHSVYLKVPNGEEFCWARELEKEAGVETVRLPSTLAPD